MQRESKEKTKREQRENTILFSRTPLDPKRENKERTKREQRENSHSELDSRAQCKERAKREQRENKERTKRESHTILYLFSHTPFDLLQCYNT